MTEKFTYKQLEKENKILKEKLNSKISDSKFESYFENNKAAMFQIDVETKRILKANKAAVNFYKYSEEELLKKTINDLFLLSASEIQKNINETVKNKSALFEFQHKTDEGEIKDVEVYTSPFKDGNKTYIYGIIHDISERKKIEKRLLKSETYFKSLTENSSDVISIIDKNGKSLYRSPSYEKVMGFSAEEMLSKNVFDFIHPDDKENLKKQIQESQSKPNQEKNISFKALHKDGTYHYLEGTGKNLLNTPINGIVINYRDVSERKKYETKLKTQNEEFASLNEENLSINEELTEKNKEYLALNEEYKIQNEELIKAKETAEENEQRFKNLANLLPQVIYECDIEGNLTFVNEQAFEFFRYTKEDFEKGLNLMQALIPEDHEKADNEFQKVLQGEKPENPNYTALRKDGTTFPVLIFSSVILKNKKTVGLRGVIIDITEIKEAENEIKSQNKKLKQITEIEKIGTFDWDLKTNLTSWNDEMFKIHGIPKQVPMPYENWVKTIHPEDVEETTSILGESITTKNPRYAEFRIIRPNGEVRDVRASATVITNEKGNVTNSIGITIDITESNKSKQELISAKEQAEENEEKFKSIFDSSPQPIVISDLSGNLIEVNNKLCQISGYLKKELIGKNVSNIGLYSINDRKIFTEKLEATGHIKDMEMKFISKENKSVNTLMNANIIKIKGIPHILSMVTDITKRKKAEQEIIKAKEKAEESDRLKTEFINNMSHEIRTPMNGILGFSELLNNPELTVEKQQNYVKIIRNSGKQLMRIIDDILEISKLGTKQVKAINEKICLNDLLLELFSIFDIKAKENKTPLYLKKGLPENKSYIYTDSSKLNKILSNLLENALKFTNTGFIEFGYQLKNNKLEIYVKDTGIGIRKEKQETIFERFSQEEKEVSEHAGGLGLGLSIAKENAELLGGTITLKSKKNKGSIFYITIPYKPSNDTNNQKNQKMNKHELKTILIAEDEEVNFIYIETLLEYFEKDIEAIHAKDGKQAVEFCKKRPDIDFVLMDIKMPIMDGYEATRQIKKIRPDLPVIAQTAYSTPEEKEKALKAGCDDFISKPISKEIFSKVIDKYRFV